MLATDYPLIIQKNMKKYIAGVFLIATIMASGTFFTRVQAQEMSLQDIVQLLIALDIIPAEKANIARLAVGLPEVTPTVESTPVVNPTVESTYTSTPVQVIPQEPVSPAYSLDDQKCIVNSDLYGTTTPQAIYYITPSTGFNRALIRGTVVSENNTTTTYSTIWTPYTVPASSVWYNPQIANIKAGIDGLNDGDTITYNIYLYNGGEEVYQFDGQLQYHSCK